MSTNPQSFQTHTVENQPPPFEDRDLWSDDAVLRAAVRREGAVLPRTTYDAIVAGMGGHARPGILGRLRRMVTGK